MNAFDKTKKLFFSAFYIDETENASSFAKLFWSFFLQSFYLKLLCCTILRAFSEGVCFTITFFETFFFI